MRDEKIEELVKDPFWRWPSRGLLYFVCHPKLWLGPILTVVIAYCLLLALFSLILYWAWPQSGVSWLSYGWGVVKAFGYSIASLLILWAVALPLGLTLCFEGLIKKVLKNQGGRVIEESLFRSLYSGLYVLFHTLGWRLFWPVATLILSFSLGPIGFFVGQIGMAHIATLDGIDLSLALQGYKGEERMAFLNKFRKDLLLGAVVGGFLSMMLSFTFIGWLFWLPGMFTAGALWTRKYLHENRN